MNPPDPTEQILSNALKRAIEDNSPPEKIESLKKALEDWQNGAVRKGSGKPARTWRTTLAEIVVLAFGIVCLGYALVTFISDQQLARTGIRTQGVVIEVKTSYYQKGGDFYTPIIQFTASNGTAYQFSAPGSHFPPRYSVDERVDVVYDPANPSVAQIVGADNTFLVVAGGVIGLSCLIVVVYSIRTRHRKPA